MSGKHSTLAEFVQRTMKEKDLSFRKVAERSGGAVSHSTVAEIANGQRMDVRADTLTALAKGLNVPEADVFQAARGIVPSASERFELYAERFDAHDLTETEWQFLELYFRDQVERFRRDKAAMRDFVINDARPPAPVVARIEPGTTKADVQKMIEADATPAEKKRKAG